MSVTQDIKDRLDIVSYIQQFAPTLKRAGRNYKALCPFHTEKTPSFVVNPDTQTWRCYGACADGGDIFSFAMKQHGWDFKEALRELGELAGVEVRQQTPQQRAQQEQFDRLRGLLDMAATLYHQHLMSDDDKSRRVLHYVMQKRGLTAETIRDYRIGYAPDSWQTLLDKLREIGYSDEDCLAAGVASRNDKGNTYDRFRNRLIIPIQDERGRVVGFGARALSKADKAKYINSPQSDLFNKSKLLYGLDRAKHAIRDTETAIIVEGYLDALQAHQAGYLNVVAQMGTALTEDQLTRLVPRYAKKIVMALDSDAAGQSATRRSLDVARRALEADYAGRLSVDIRILQMPGAKDPDDFLRETPDRWTDLVNAAQPVAEFVMDLETASLPESPTIQEKQQVAARVLPILSASENQMYRRDNLQKLALRLRMSEEDLLAWARDLEAEARQREQARQRQAARRQPAESSQPPDLPPFEADGDVPPPDYDGDDVDFVVPPGADAASLRRRTTVPHLASRHSSRETEAYCLQMLFRNPDLLYRVNRKLRELARNDETLLSGPLGNFSVEDFSQVDYKMLLNSLIQSLEQHELNHLDYVRRNLDDDVLMKELDQLLQDDPDHHRITLNHRFKGDFDHIWEDFARKKQDLRHDTIQRALTVRLNRLHREYQEMTFLVEELQGKADQSEIKDLMRHLISFNQAIDRIQPVTNLDTPQPEPHYQSSVNPSMWS